MNIAKMTAMATLACISLQSNAQTHNEEKEIIIERKSNEKKSDLNKKETIVIIDGDKITIDGKTFDKFGKGFENDKITKIILNGKALSSNSIYGGPKGSMQWTTTDSKKAQLGVMSTTDDKGAKITEVMENTAAAQAGLKANDIITAIDNNDVKNPEDLSKIITAKKIDDVVEITYLRDGKKLKTKATLKQSTATGAIALNNRYLDFQEFRTDGLSSNNISKFRFDGNDMFANLAARPKYGMDVQDTEEGDGVKVVSVEPGSAAEKAGLQVDDVITTLNGEAVTNLDMLKKELVTTTDKTSHALTVKRNNSQKNIELKVPKRIKKASL